MTPALAMTIDAARDLAWRPTSNLGGPRAIAYGPRLEAHQRLVSALTKTSYRDYRVTAMADPELRFLVAAIRRVAACSFSNRMGLPYYERKQAVAELRGCLITYDRSLAPASRPGRDFVETTAPAASSRRHGRIGTPEPMPALL